MDLPPIHDCKYRRWWEEAAQRRSQAVFSGWTKLEAELPIDIFKWLTRLSEIGPLGEVGVGEIRRIREFGVACWRRGVAAEKESEALKRRTSTIRAEKKRRRKP